MKQKHYGLSIIIHYCGTDFNYFRSFLNANFHLFRENGVEVLIIFNQKQIAVDILSYIASRPFCNWKLIYAEYNTEIDFYEIAGTYSIFKNLLFIDATYQLLATTITEIRKLYSFYSAAGIAALANTALGDFSHHPYENYKMILLLDKGNLLRTLMDAKQKDSILTTYSDLTRAMQQKGDIILFIEKAFKVLPYSRTPYPHAKKTDGELKHRYYFNYLNKAHLQQNALDYLETFEDFSLKPNTKFTEKIPILALVSVYNERKHLGDFLNNLGRSCDGIILLDDGSEDGSYENVNHEKLILKVKKKRFTFDDLENRNILLKLSFFFNVDWILFMDADERISGKFEHIRTLTLQKDKYVHLLNFVNLWDSPNFFRQDMEGAKNHNRHGIYRRHRLFKNFGFTQIKLDDERKLHFPTVPYFENTNYSKVLVYHLGLRDQEDRQKKYVFYKKQDQWITKDNYDYLLDQHVSLRHVDSIVPENLNDW
jgi:hypothetical protein